MVPGCHVRVIKKWKASVRIGWFFSFKKNRLYGFFAHRFEPIKVQGAAKNCSRFGSCYGFLVRFDRSMCARIVSGQGQKNDAPVAGARSRHFLVRGLGRKIGQADGTLFIAVARDKFLAKGSTSLFYEPIKITSDQISKQRYRLVFLPIG
jgi:hypothetical protein